MNMFWKKKSLAPFLMLPFGLSLQAAEVESFSEAKTLDTLIVVGEKTDRSLKDTSSSVSVIPFESISTMQHQTVTDAVTEVANVVSLSGAVPDIRGVSGNGGAGGFNSVSGGANARVSILVDGVAEPFVADLTGDSGIWDVEQIEVYRGPQSTSNGRNSIAGSIYIKTADPTFDWEGAARVGYRNEEDYLDTSLMLSGPIIEDKLAFRVTAQRLDAETTTNDTEFATNPADYDLNEIRTDRYKAKLLWKMSPDTDLLFTHSTNNEQGDVGRRYYEANDPWKYNRIFLRDIETDSDTTSLKIDSRINDNVSTDILLAYMDYQWGFYSYEPVAANQQYLQFDETNITVDAKINYVSDDHSLSGFIGFTHFEREQDILSTGRFVYAGDDESDSNSIYGEVDYSLTDKWSVIAGGRLQKETQRRDFVMGAIDARLDKDQSIFLPKLVFQYDLTDLTTLSFGGRRGYSSAGGALDFFAADYYFYDEEKVNTYEIGLRTSSQGDNTHLTATLFYNDYGGYQALSSSRRIVNIDEVVTYGAELELVMTPRADLELRAGLGLLKTDIKDAGAGYASATGNELNSAPDVTASLGVKYWLTEAFNMGLSAKYLDEYFGDIDNTEGRVAGDYTTVRLNANYLGDNWVISAFVNNLFDTKKFITEEPVSGRYPNGYVAVVERRNVGVSVTYEF